MPQYFSKSALAQLIFYGQSSPVMFVLPGVAWSTGITWRHGIAAGARVTVGVAVMLVVTAAVNIIPAQDSYHLLINS